MKRIVWISDSLNRVKSFPPTARAKIGFQLTNVMDGYKPSKVIEMFDIGKGVRCILIEDRVTYHVVYYDYSKYNVVLTSKSGHPLIFPEIVCIIHAFHSVSGQSLTKSYSQVRKNFQTIVKF